MRRFVIATRDGSWMTDSREGLLHVCRWKYRQNAERFIGSLSGGTKRYTVACEKITKILAYEKDLNSPRLARAKKMQKQLDEVARLASDFLKRFDRHGSRKAVPTS